MVAVFAVFNAVAQHLLGWAFAASSGAAWLRPLKHADGGTYSGEWSGADKSGLGVYKYASGARFEGQWDSNVKHGMGVHHYADGGKFEGGFVRGQRSGIGLRSWPSGVSKACTAALIGCVCT